MAAISLEISGQKVEKLHRQHLAYQLTTKLGIAGALTKASILKTRFEAVIRRNYLRGRLWISLRQKRCVDRPAVLSAFETLNTVAANDRIGFERV